MWEIRQGRMLSTSYAVELVNSRYAVGFVCILQAELLTDPEQGTD